MGKKEWRKKRDEDEGEDILKNINEVTTDGDLSPRHIKELRTGGKVSKATDKVRSTRSSLAKPPLSK